MERHASPDLDLAALATTIAGELRRTDGGAPWRALPPDDIAYRAMISDGVISLSVQVQRGRIAVRGYLGARVFIGANGDAPRWPDATFAATRTIPEIARTLAHTVIPQTRRLEALHRTRERQHEEERRRQEAAAGRLAEALGIAHGPLHAYWGGASLQAPLSVRARVDHQGNTDLEIHGAPLDLAIEIAQHLRAHGHDLEQSR